MIDWESGVASGHVTHDGAETRVALRGEFDLYAREELRRLLYDPGVRRRVVLDLAEASFVDSTTLGELLRFRRWLEARGGSLAIECSHAEILRAFAVTGLDRVFEIRAAATGVAC